MLNRPLQTLFYLAHIVGHFLSATSTRGVLLTQLPTSDFLMSVVVKSFFSRNRNKVAKRFCKMCVLSVVSVKKNVNWDETS